MSADSRPYTKKAVDISFGDNPNFKVINGYEYQKTVWGTWGWVAPCYKALVWLNSEQPGMNIEFHLLTCEECSELAWADDE